MKIQQTSLAKIKQFALRNCQAGNVHSTTLEFQASDRAAVVSESPTDAIASLP
ncbi:hypothetical protein [Scytonema millei]|uniref:Uncharacterized protein n=1 Tax=Scytonema millei VB511283 TaxID=1245923 RepID=A0A9X5I6J3_9CYAN|nr:hypothetical protein [Scytonema millei]NHC36602.1 hypothetical protein [Scytonema millei VB511283]